VRERAHTVAVEMAHADHDVRHTISNIAIATSSVLLVTDLGLHVQ
jgi:hypothetical protein